MMGGYGHRVMGGLCAFGGFYVGMFSSKNGHPKYMGLRPCLLVAVLETDLRSG